MTAEQKIAILVFAYSPNEEKKYKPFLSKQGLADSLDTHLKDLIQSCRLPVFNFDEKNQVGNSFSARFTNAVQTVFKQGYDGIISIGNDCPALNSNHIKKAEIALKQGKTVLGPSFDGGMYLIGITRQSFQYNTFLALPWNTEYLFQEFLEESNKTKDEQLILETLGDIDTFIDLENLSIHLINNITLVKIILAILAHSRVSYIEEKLNILELYIPIISNKGSPLAKAS